MPSSAQHANRVIELLHFCEDANTAKYKSERVIAMAYAALHMFECLAYDFSYLTENQKHFPDHGTRNSLIGRKTEYGKPLFLIAKNYSILHSFGARARYLSPPRSTGYMPITDTDATQAETLFTELKKETEALYEKNTQKAPWL